MRPHVVFTALAVLACVSAGAGASSSPKAGDVVLTADFEAADALEAFPIRVGAVAIGTVPGGGRALVIEVPPSAERKVAQAAARLNAAGLRGCKLLLSARVRAEAVSARPQPWNGVKFMTPITTPGGKVWPQAAIDTGTFDWRRVQWQTYVPDEATEMTLVLGLENVTGKVLFDDVRVTVRRLPRPLPQPVPSGPVYRGHSLPRLRGAMVHYDISEDGLRVLGGQWNANLVRWQLLGWQPPAAKTDLAAFDDFLESHLRKLDAALPLCEKYGLMVVVDLHAAPTGPPGSGRGLFNDSACQSKFVEVWHRIARRYKDSKAVWGFDLLNEPMEDAVDESCADWQDLAERAARAIRQIDPERAIIVEPATGGGPEGFHELRPLAVKNVVYSVHMYLPHAFTHQGVGTTSAAPCRYPGDIGGKTWDKAALERALKPVVDFADRYGVHIYVGEFSAIRWAPDSSACRYIKDLIDIFESRGWDWTYHAFREWHGWSVEHGPDRADTSPAAEPTDRQRLLMEWFARNAKPTFFPVPTR